MTTVLVTGCMGFIGSSVARDLLLAGHKVIGVDNLSRPSLIPTDRIKAAVGDKWANFKFFKKDIRDFDGLYEVFLHEKPDAVIHLAAMGSVPLSFQYPIDFYEVNCAGFATVLNVARDMGVRRVVYASSSSVYGDAQGATRKEGCEGRALSPYAISKVQNEMHADIWGRANKMELIGLRFFNVYGPGQLYDTKFSAVIPQWITSEKIKINGNAVRDYTFVDDASRAVLLALESKSFGFSCNVGTGVGTSLADLSAIIGVADKEVEVLPPRTGDVTTSIASTVYAQNQIGFAAAVDRHEGVSRTKEFYQVFCAW